MRAIIADKKSLLPAVLLLSMLAFLCCSKSTDPPPPPENFITNSGFEDESSEYPGAVEGWYPVYLAETVDFVMFDWDTTVSHGGDRSVSIEIDESHPSQQILYSWSTTIDGPEIGKKYEVSGWIKTQDLQETALIWVGCVEQDTMLVIGWASTYQGYTVDGTSGWTFVRATWTVPAGTAFLIVRAGLRAPENAGGKVWFDDIKVIKK